MIRQVDDTIQQLLNKITQQVAILAHQVDILAHQVNMLQIHNSIGLINISLFNSSTKVFSLTNTSPINISPIPNDDQETISQPPKSDSLILSDLQLLSDRPIAALDDSSHIEKKSEDKDFIKLSCFSQPDNSMIGNGTFKSTVLIYDEDSGSTRNYSHPRTTIFLDWEIGRSATFSIVMRSRKSNYANKLYEAMIGTYEHELFATMLDRNGKNFFEKVVFIFDPGGDTFDVRGVFRIWHKYDDVNAYFSLFMALGNVIGFASESYNCWYKILSFTITEACSVNSINLKSAFLIDIVLLTITTYITVSSTIEIPFTYSIDGTKLSSSPEEVFFEEVIGAFRYLTLPIWTSLIVTALIWIGWFLFIQFDTDWLGREIYRGGLIGGGNYHSRVEMGSFGLMLQSIVLDLTSVGLEKMCKKWGAGFVWEILNLIMFLCFIAMIILSFVASKVEYSSKGLPLDGIVLVVLGQKYRKDETSPSTKMLSENKIFIFDPGGIFHVECIFDLEDKVNFEGMVMIRLNDATRPVHSGATRSVTMLHLTSCMI